MPEQAGPASLGVYEKTLPEGLGWPRTFQLAARAGFDFFEMSIDATESRQARLNWDQQTRRQVRSDADSAGVGIRVLTLSAHREAPWGSADEAVRQRADELALRSIDLAHDLDAECVQIAGYFTFEGPRAPNARELFIDGLGHALDYARMAGIKLAVENVDGTDVTSVTAGLALRQESGLEDLLLYIDVGNLAGNCLDVVSELKLGLPHAFCVQLKDARPGVFRRVPFGEGTVPFSCIFDTLVASPPVPVSVEMWNDDNDTTLSSAAARWVGSTWQAAQQRATF